MSTVRHGHFEWDSTKALANLRKHRVSFEEAAGCFLDPHGLDLADGAIIRIISARRATTHEKALYEDEP